MVTRRSRALVLVLSVPVALFFVVGGWLARTMSAQGPSTYEHLRIFEDVVSLISRSYVEQVDVDRVMHGAMHGLADGLDPDSAYLDKTQVAAFQRKAAPPAGDTGLELTRQYYLRVIAALDGSPAAQAGLQPGDYIRAIDGQSTRDTSVFEGMRLLRGAPGSTVRLTVLRGTAVDPHDVVLTHAALKAPAVSSRLAAPGAGLIRIPGFTADTAAQVTREVTTLRKAGATRLLVDLRGTATGDLDAALPVARLFVRSGTLSYRQERDAEKVAVAAAAGDGSISLPVVLMTDNGTSGAAEVFAAALHGNTRASLVGERTLGRAARQKLVALPDGSGLLLTYQRYLMPGGAAISPRGLSPDVAVAQPTREFGVAPPAGDPILDKALTAEPPAPPASPGA
ncbi:MAG: PDZ domain-containing protein [Acidobacteria bacterium]|nr:PDZ domain-containing protein [Acidobacteriota bacterium]